VVGEVEVTYDVFAMPGEPCLSITTYTAAEGSETADKLALLSTWAATDNEQS
jgi:MmyB-like transcription regulator ligand binding domain